MSKPRTGWTGQRTLAHRILAVNLLTIALLGFKVLYLDAFRNQLADERLQLVSREASMSASALSAAPREARPAVLQALARASDSRLRLYGPDGRLRMDSWRFTGPSYTLRDPAGQRWTKDLARGADRAFNALVGAKPVQDFAEPRRDQLAAWPEARRARANGSVVTDVRNAPDLTPVWSAAAPLGEEVLLITTNDRDYTRTVRTQRRWLLGAMAIAIALSVMLSLFLARTIVRPLRRIALAAHRVRLGRAREVNVPRLPSRRDEIGFLARAVSDMSQSLRQRIDNIENFAADVTHELKNPLASLRSAVEGLE
nr:sensor N-terminal transmembrane domain-containing protein [Sphingomonas sp.]